jgi:Tfp pilus assembly protein FimT
LVAIISIVGIVAAIAIPRFSGSYARHRVDSAAKRLEIDLKLVRDQAVHQGRALEMVFVTGTRPGYSVAGLLHLDSRDVTTYTVDLSDEPYRVSSISLSVGGDDRIAFDGFGVPDSSGSITLGIGSYMKTVVVEAGTGDLRIDTP